MENKKKAVPGIIYTDDRAKTPEEKTYLILLEGEMRDNENLSYRDFEWVVGRQNAYDYLKDLIVNVDDVDFIIDIFKSVVISDSVYINDYITVYEFLKQMKLNNKVIDESDFDIEEYNIE